MGNTPYSQLSFFAKSQVNQMRKCGVIFRNLVGLTLLLSLALSSIKCTHTNAPLDENHIATQWADLALMVTRFTPGNSPTYASRALGYISVAQYESIVHGYPQYKSLSGQLNELEQVPLPEKNLTYNWLVSLNACQAYILKKMYNHTSDKNKSTVDSLETSILDQITSSSHISTDTEKRSVAYGRAVAEAIFKWSETDGGHRGYLRNFDKKITYPTNRGQWRPALYAQSFSHFPLHPHWGKNRTFLKASQSLPIPQIVKYDTQRHSSYYKQFEEVYVKNNQLTQEEKEIALWWGDDPSETFTPPGHSYYLATLAIKKARPTLIKSVEAYARVGIAVADAFINCWKIKYIHFSERPSTFINENIDETWIAFWPDPPFPAFPSGHAMQAGAVATVLTDMFGENFSIKDDCHAGRPADEERNVQFKSRSFESFWQVAEETANSRFYGGIHTQQDNKVGLQEGKVIGTTINHLAWHSSH
jgi:hypothetical protein